MTGSLVVIIDDFDIVSVVVAPYEADPPLRVDPDAVLAGAITAQGLEAIAWERR